MVFGIRVAIMSSIETETENDTTETVHYSKAVSILTTNADIILKYLSISDIFQGLYIVSKNTSGIVLSADTINFLMSSDIRLAKLGPLSLTTKSQLSLGVLQKTFYHLISSGDAHLSISPTGRINVDVGTAFSDSNEHYTASVARVASREDGEVPEAEARVEKYLEDASFDEYDDFTPTHPLPKGHGTHRRGNSLFNSDIELYAAQALNYAYDMSDLASIATNGVNQGQGYEKSAKMANLTISSSDSSSSREKGQRSFGA